MGCERRLRAARNESSALRRRSTDTDALGGPSWTPIRGPGWTPLYTQVGASLKGLARSVSVLDLPDLPHKGDLSDWLDLGGDREALLELVDTSSRAWAPQPPATRFGAVLWRDIASIKPRTDHLVEDLMFRGDLGLCYGESRAGKSFVKLDLSLSIARGVPFFGMKTMQAPVAYQAGEGALGAIGRLQAYGIENRVATADLPFVLMKSRVNLFSKDGDVDAFIAELLEWQEWLGRPFGLVTIDTFSAATPGANENASEDVSIVLGNGHKIREATGAAVGFVHHKNAGGQKARGHTSIFADADFAIDVSRDEATNERSFKLAKVKDGEDGKEFGFYLQPVEIGTKEDGRPITSCVVRPAALTDETQGKEGRSTSAQTTNYLRTLKETLRRHGHYAAQGVPVPNRLTKVVEYEVFREALKAKAEPGTSDETFRQQIKRVGEKLLAEDRIGRHQKSEDGAAVIWITESGEFGK